MYHFINVLFFFLVRSFVCQIFFFCLPCSVYTHVYRRFCNNCSFVPPFPTPTFVLTQFEFLCFGVMMTGNGLNVSAVAGSVFSLFNSQGNLSFKSSSRNFIHGSTLSHWIVVEPSRDNVSVVDLVHCNLILFFFFFFWDCVVWQK